MATETQTETVEVDIYGQKVALPKDAAAALIKTRDADKAERRTQAERLGALEASANEAKEAQRKAAEEAELAKLTSKGEYEKALQIEREKLNGKLGKLASSFKAARLEAEIAKTEGVLPAAVKDIATQLSISCDYDLDAASLIFRDSAGRPVTGEDGKAVAADAVIKQFLQDRPYFRAATGQPGSGAAGAGKQGSGKAISASAIEAMTPSEQGKFFADGGTLAK